MEIIKKLGLLFCVLMVLSAYIRHVIPKGKMNRLMNTVVSLFVMVSLITGFSQINFERVKLFVDPSNYQNEDDWADYKKKIEEGLRNEFSDYIASNGLDASVQTVILANTRKEYKISMVQISGQEAITARELLAGRYNIEKENIEVIDE